MRSSQMLVPTLRENPAEAEVISHILLVRAGFIRKSTTGVYAYLPLAQRVLTKIKAIVKEEMDKKGGQELMLPVIQPAELWQESGRWDVYGPELFRLKDRHDRDFCLGPTHEEIITDLARSEIRSYKQMPMLLYQIQNKYRDERRPRFGLLRGREFIMKDLYSFDCDQAGLDISYQKMYDAYTAIFNRCGLEFRPVEADSGAIGGKGSHEFMVLADSGEAEIVYCSQCAYAANVEQAEAVYEQVADQSAELLPLTEVLTEGQKTVEEVLNFLQLSPQQIIKTLFYMTDKGIIAALVRGDREVNEIKLLNELDTINLEMAGEQDIIANAGCQPGYVGPVGLNENIRIIADKEVAAIVNGVCGANKVNYHLKNVNAGRDFRIDVLTDLRLVKAGEACSKCGAPLISARGIEVGQVFKLGTKYSEALGATFLDENGKSKPIVMGCYGIGVSRTMAAAVEQNYDENGIIWPVSIAPYHVVIVPVSTKDEQQMQLAEKLYSELEAAGVEVMFDDRKERPGVKFKDADLIGYPLRITVGAKAANAGEVEIKTRRNGDIVMCPAEEAVAKVRELLGL